MPCQNCRKEYKVELLFTCNRLLPLPVSDGEGTIRWLPVVAVDVAEELGPASLMFAE